MQWVVDSALILNTGSEDIKEWLKILCRKIWLYAMIRLYPNTANNPKGFFIRTGDLQGASADSAIPFGKSGWDTGRPFEFL